MQLIWFMWKKPFRYSDQIFLTRIQSCDATPLQIYIFSKNIYIEKAPFQKYFKTELQVSPYPLYFF